MGLFDSVYVDCPHCGAPVEFQSKASDDASLRRFTLSDAPTEILVSVLNSPEHCMSCGGWLALVDPKFPPEPIRPEPQVCKTRTPENPLTHFQGMKWWPHNEPFSYGDLIEAEEPVAHGTQGIAGQ